MMDNLEEGDEGVDTSQEVISDTITPIVLASKIIDTLHPEDLMMMSHDTSRSEVGMSEEEEGIILVIVTTIVIDLVHLGIIINHLKEIPRTCQYNQLSRQFLLSLFQPQVSSKRHRHQNLRVLCQEPLLVIQ